MPTRARQRILDAAPGRLAVTGRGLGLLAARRGNTAEAMRSLDGAYHQTSDLPPAGSAARPVRPANVLLPRGLLISTEATAAVETG
jgi:hypothetical protein